MSTSMTYFSYHEYMKHNYRTALEVYTKLANDIGVEFYNYNITRCLKKIGKGQQVIYSIFDEISNKCWSNEFTLIPLTKEYYQQQMDEKNKVLFLESCWHGNNDNWIYAFTSPELKHTNAQRLCKLLEYAKKQGIKTVFWNKEDPMHYATFLPIASKCDVILTTDINMVEKYRKDVPGAIVDVLMFAANQHICNPANRFLTTQQTMCFAGTYYGEGHDERKKQMDQLLPLLLDFNGIIYDRMSGQNNPRYFFPYQYYNIIRNSVPFEKIAEIYKQFKIFLNVNTIIDSPTMMSRRVYELLASGTPVLSTPSKAVDKQFSGIVQIASNISSAKNIVQKLLEDEWSWLRLSHRGYREVMEKHTYTQRAQTVKQLLGIDIIKAMSLVTIVIISYSPRYLSRLINNISCQTYENKEAIIVIQNYSDNDEEVLRNKLSDVKNKFSKFTIIRNESMHHLGTSLNTAIQHSNGEYIIKMEDKDLYFEHYVSDMILPFSYTNASIIGKKERFIYLENYEKLVVLSLGQRHMYTDYIADSTLVIKKSIFANINFCNNTQKVVQHFIASAREYGVTIYAADPFNHVIVAPKSNNRHIFHPEADVLREGKLVGDGLCPHICAL